MRKLKNSSLYSFFRCKQDVIFPATFWCAGLFLGIHHGSRVEGLLRSYLLVAAEQNISFLTILILHITPFVLFGFCVYLKRFIYLGLLLALYAYTTGFCLYGIIAVYSSAAWLVTLLMCISGITQNVLLLYLSIRSLSVTKRVAKPALKGAVLLSSLVGIINYIYIAPFLSALMSNT